MSPRRNNWWMAGLGVGLAVLAVAMALRGGGSRAVPPGPATEAVADVSTTLPQQTDVDRAEHLFDEAGVPLLRIKGVGDVRNPAWVGLYALEYFGVEKYGAGMPVGVDEAKGRACAEWLAKHLKADGSGDMVWEYGFDDTYNDVTVKAPWCSAFGQAVGIQALIESTRHGAGKENIDVARKAAEALLRPMGKGGLMFERGEDAWFEEIAAPAANPPHILNGHMRVLLALRELAGVTGDTRVAEAYQRGLATLERWLPLYDSGYWLRYDLNPRKGELLFRVSNPYGFALPEVAIDKVILRDPASGKEVAINIGDAGDGEGALRIAGNDWSQPTALDGRMVRRLRPVMPASLEEERDGEIHGPGTFFYLKLPTGWADNLRAASLELEIDYKDEAAGNACVQMRTIGPGANGSAFHDLRDGDLLLSGSGEWRSWRIRVRPEDLGYWVGMNYGSKHAEYLEALASGDAQLKPWAMRARGYVEMAQAPGEMKIAQQKPEELPHQTPVLIMYSLDKDGVMMEHLPGPRTHFLANGEFDHASEGGEAMYQPFTVAQQARYGGTFVDPATVMDLTFLKAFPEYYAKYQWVTPENCTKLQRAPALEWLAAHGKAVGMKDEALLWTADFDNAYNDVATKGPWASAFFQSYVALAFFDAWNDKVHDPALDFATLTKKAERAFFVPLKSGGLMGSDLAGRPFFEEVSNGTHVLNAQLTVINTLGDIGKKLPEAALEAGRSRGIEALREHLSGYDAGYWLRYDANPKKDVMFQLDWVAGGTSPLIESVTLENPVTKTATRVAVGNDGAFEAYPGIGGVDWLAAVNVDGKMARGFVDGNEKRKESLAGAARQNVFFQGVLPEREFGDLFEVPSHRLIMRYKDIAPGEFEVKIRSINAGNEMAFVPLRGGMLHCAGDGKWKEAVFEVRPQDLGWFVGMEYQVYQVEQLAHLAQQTGDWYFAQAAERERYFLEAYKKKVPVIAEPRREALRDVTSLAKVVSSSPMYAGYGVENALDGDPNNNYAAATEGPLPQEFVLHLDRKVNLQDVIVEWESAENFGTKYEVDALDADGGATPIVIVEDGTGQRQDNWIKTPLEVQNLRFIVHELHGQQRLLMRLLKLVAAEPE